jgi:hypothetical protein
MSSSKESLENKSAIAFLKRGRKFCRSCWYKIDKQCAAGDKEFAECQANVDSNMNMIILASLIKSQSRKRKRS